MDVGRSSNALTIFTKRPIIDSPDAELATIPPQDSRSMVILLPTAGTAGSTGALAFHPAAARMRTAD
jgi:hypothetical protein